jgi:hypothetical protein
MLRGEVLLETTNVVERLIAAVVHTLEPIAFLLIIIFNVNYFIQLITYLSNVRIGVLIEVVNILKLFVAKFTLELLHTYVFAELMSAQIRQQGEGKVTTWLLAFEGFQLVVNSLMFAKRCGLGEPCTAYGTRQKVSKSALIDLPLVVPIFFVGARVVVERLLGNE